MARGIQLADAAPNRGIVNVIEFIFDACCRSSNPNGAMALQNGALNWSAAHRVHHRYIDDPERDPLVMWQHRFYIPLA